MEKKKSKGRKIYDDEKGEGRRERWKQSRVGVGDWKRSDMVGDDTWGAAVRGWNKKAKEGRG